MLKRLTLWTLTPLLLIALAVAPTAIINGAQLFPWDFGKIAINYTTNTNTAPFTGWLGIELDDEQLSELTVHTGDDRGNDIIAINGTWNHPSDYIRAFNREPNQIFVYTEIPTGGRTEIDIYGANPNLNEPGGAPLASDDAPLITYTPAQPGQTQQFSTEITLEIPRDGTALRPQQYRLSSESGVQLKVTPVTDESGTVTALNCECSAYTSGGDILYSTEQTLQQWLAVDGYTRTVLVDKLVDYTATVEQQITEDYTATIVVPGPNIGQIVKEHFVIYEELTGFLYDEPQPGTTRLPPRQQQPATDSGRLPPLHLPGHSRRRPPLLVLHRHRNHPMQHRHHRPGRFRRHNRPHRRTPRANIQRLPLRGRPHTPLLRRQRRHHQRRTLPGPRPPHQRPYPQLHLPPHLGR